MNLTVTHLDAFLEKMELEGMPELAQKSFAFYYKQLVEGSSGMIGEEEIVQVDVLPDYEKLEASYADFGRSVMHQAALLKLNGGLGTSMGLAGPKTLLPVRGVLSFLDIIAQQALHWDISLVLMNSFSTVAASREKLSEYGSLKKAVPQDFLQHKIPKIDQSNLKPVSWPADAGLEWCPPGHGDIYTALVTTGMLEKMLEAGIRYVFVSNGDNLGAIIEPALLGYFAKHNLPFLMEVADRTEADKKGGHLAFDLQGQLLLRESAQCPAGDKDHFQDVSRHRFFNTNNLWLNLEALRDKLQETEGIMGLPMIRNGKTVDPRNSESTPVFQLETAMGAALSVFEGAGAIRVPRSRFAPVKTTNELLAVQSDAYVMGEDFTLALHASRDGRPCAINLESSIYKKVDDLQARFPYGPPSLLACDQLTVIGDVLFGKDIVCKGRVEIENRSGVQKEIQDGAELSGQVVL